MKRLLSLSLALLTILSMFAGCSQPQNQVLDDSSTPSAPSDSSNTPLAPSTDNTDDDTAQKKQISLWFWSAPAEHQVVLKEALEEAVNSMQNKYELTITFQAGVDNLIATALAADGGPDIVYTSGPSYVTNFVTAGKLANLDIYAERYGWKERSIESIYNLTTHNGSLYSLTTSLTLMGVFCNKKVISELGFEMPTTVAEMETIMDAAIAKGLYGGVTGNKQWKPVNGNYVSLFLNHFAGADQMYQCMTCAEKWNNPAMVDALNISAEWYQKGYLGGDNYYDLSFDESVQLLALGRAPFFVGPSNVFQWATKYFLGVTAEDFDFIPFPAVSENDVQYPMYVLGSVACLGINEASPYKDECAEILDYFYSNNFFQVINNRWPGYWAIPLQDLDIPEDATGVAAVWNNTLRDVYAALEKGNYGYYTISFLPPATETASQDIDSIWQGTMTAEDVLDHMDAEFAKEQDLVVPLEERG